MVPKDHRGGEAPHSPGLTTGGQSWGEETDTPPQGFLPPLSGSVLEGHGAAEDRPYTGRVTTQVTQRREGKTEENSSPGRLENALDTFSMTAG